MTTPLGNLPTPPTVTRRGFRLRLVDDWRECWKYGSIHIAATFAGLYLAVPRLLPSLADQWPNVAPFVMRFFPHADGSVAPAIGSLLIILARVLTFDRRGE